LKRVFISSFRLSVGKCTIAFGKFAAKTDAIGFFEFKDVDPDFIDLGGLHYWLVTYNVCGLYTGSSLEFFKHKIRI